VRGPAHRLEMSPDASGRTQGSSRHPHFVRPRAACGVRTSKGKVMEIPSIPMTVPYYIGEAKSDIRGIKSGWYAMDQDGNLLSGPFSSRQTCVERNIQPAKGSPPSGLF